MSGVARTCVATALCAGLSSVAACHRGGGPPSPPPSSAPPAIEVVAVVQRPLDATASMPGELEPYETIALYPRVTGFVKSVRVDRGSRVKSGGLVRPVGRPQVRAPPA